ncbi:MAG: T9SS type A sorting domain-containing protein, partial [Candidatus Zixiibacteriota bacterium]
LDVFNILGQKVKTLVDAPMPAGRHTVSWDGTGNGGRPVASGIYFYRLKASSFAETRKMILLK